MIFKSDNQHLPTLPSKPATSPSNFLLFSSLAGVSTTSSVGDRKEGRKGKVCVYRRNDLISCGCLASQGARREGGWSVALVTLWHPAWQEAGSQSGDDPSSPFPAANIGPPPPLLSPGAMLASLPLPFSALLCLLPGWDVFAPFSP